MVYPYRSYSMRTISGRRQAVRAVVEMRPDSASQHERAASLRGAKATVSMLRETLAPQGPSRVLFFKRELP